MNIHIYAYTLHTRSNPARALTRAR